MNSSLGFRFRRVALASVIFGLIAGACDVGKTQGAPCTVTADCMAGSECSGGHCVPYTACMTDAQCSGGQQCASGACRTTCTTDEQCASLGFVCALPAGQCMPKPTMSSGGSGGTSGDSAGSAGTLSTSGSGGDQTSGGASGSSGMAMGPTSDLVDDLEDNDGRITMAGGRQGGWYAFSDGSIMPPAPDDNANSNGFMPASPGANSSQHAVHVSASGFGNYAGVAVDFNNSGVRPKDTANRKVYDVSAYDGVVFQAKGMSSGSMRIMAVTQQIAGKAEGGTCDDSNTGNHCWESYGKDFTLSSDWTEVRVRFSDMTTGNSSPFDPKSVFGLAFQDNAQNGSLDLWIDDLALFKDGTPTGGGGTGSGGTSSGGTSSGGGSAGATSCSSLPGSPNPGSGSFTFYYFGQGTAQEGGKYKTACGYTGTESGMTDTVSNIVNPSYFAAIPGASDTNFDTVGHCGECVKITNGDKSIVATIIDECPVTGKYPNPACTPEHLDLSWQAWKDLGYNVGNPSGTTWQFVPCDIKGNVQLSFNGPNEVYVQNLIVPVQSVKMNGAMGNHTSYGSWQFGSGVQGQMLTITDVAGRTITVTANGDTGKQFPGCN